MGDVIDFDAVKNSDSNEIVLTAAGQFEQMADKCIAILRISDKPKDVEQAIATLMFMGAKLDELESRGVDLDG